MAVLPEAMKHLDGNDAAASLAVVESYIGYMGERMEFSLSQLSRTVTALEDRVKALERQE